MTNAVAVTILGTKQQPTTQNGFVASSEMWAFWRTSPFLAYRQAVNGALRKAVRGSHPHTRVQIRTHR